jgi:hypothetical protein
MTPAGCGFGSLAIPATQALRIITHRPMVRHITTLTIIIMILAARITAVLMEVHITAGASTEAVVATTDFFSPNHTGYRP